MKVWGVTLHVTRFQSKSCLFIRVRVEKLDSSIYLYLLEHNHHYRKERQSPAQLSDYFCKLQQAVYTYGGIQIEGLPGL